VTNTELSRLGKRCKIYTDKISNLVNLQLLLEYQEKVNNCQNQFQKRRQNMCNTKQCSLGTVVFNTTLWPGNAGELVRGYVQWLHLLYLFYQVGFLVVELIVLRPVVVEPRQKLDELLAIAQKNLLDRTRLVGVCDKHLEATPARQSVRPTGGALTPNSRALQTHLSYPARIARVISFWNFLA